MQRVTETSPKGQSKASLRKGEDGYCVEQKSDRGHDGGKSQQLLPLWASGQDHLVKLYKLSLCMDPSWMGIVSLSGL